MKNVSLQLLKALVTHKNYHRLNTMKLAVMAILLCGISNVGLAQISISLSSPTLVPASNVCAGAANVNVYAFTVTGFGTGAANVVSAISFTNTGTATIPTDLVRYTLWKNAGGGAGSLVATSTSSSFTGLSEAFASGTVLDYWITADIAATPTPGNTISIGIMPATNITASNGTGSVSGSAAAQGVQTIRARPTVASLGASPASLCGGGNLTLTAGATTGTGALVSYNWAGPAPYNASTPTNPNVYTTAFTGASGVYSVTVTYPGAGCTSLPATSSPVTVNDQPNLPPTMYICITGGGSPTQPAVGTIINSGATGGVWSSSNPAVVTIEPSTGRAWPVGLTGGGTSVITHTIGGCSDNTTATIAERPKRIVGTGNVYGIQHLCTEISMTLSSATNNGVWSSAFTNVATVTNGANPNNTTVVTASNIAPSSGATNIIYTDPTTGCDTATELDVHPRPFDIGGPGAVCENSTITLTNITPLGTWGSSAVLTASVTMGPGAGGGIVAGRNAGSATITYTVINTGCFKTKNITVNPVPAPITGFPIVCTNSSTSLSDITPGGVWSSGAPANVATISGGSGTSFFVNGGTVGGVTNINYTLATGCKSTVFVTVNQQPGPVTGPDHVCAGSTITLSNEISGGTWSSNNQPVATVDSTLGVVLGQYFGTSPGTALISYDLTACATRSHSVTVNPAPGPITGVKSVCVGFTISLSDTTAGGVWSSSGPSSVATISGPSVTGVGVGFIVDTYTLPSTGCFDTALILVYDNPGPILGPDSVCQGATVTLSNATPGGTWSSTVLGIAQVVDSSGVVTGITAGNVIISYTLASGCYDTVAPFRVKPPVTATVSIARSPGGILCAGSPDTYVATHVNGGIPTYQWIKFLTPVATGNTYTDIAPVNGDLVVVRMTTHFTCAIDTIVYDSLVAVVYPIAATAVTISTAPADTIASYLGQVYTFFSNVTWGGGSNAFQWYRNGTAIPGANSPTYTTPVYQNDTFYCAVTGTAPCDNAPTTGYSNIIRIYASYLGVAPPPVVSSDLILFPNPTNGGITLSGTVSAATDRELNIEVTDMLGHVVYRGKTTSQNGFVKEHIDLGSSMASGTYLLRVNSEDLSQVFRFIISK